jgi:hypothetical protein
MSEEKIKTYVNEIPEELRKIIDALNGDLGLAVFLVLFKYGELTFSEIMEELEIPPENSSNLKEKLKKLQMSALVKNIYVKEKNLEGRSFYDVTGLGEEVISNLMNVFRVDKNE